jgi:riboflavin kinase/FMN adenylyltransferase
MRIVQGSVNLPSGLPAPVLTIGNFDGVHVGHQRMFATVTARALSLGGTSICYTFEPHPQKVLAPDRCPPLIVTPRKKLELIGREGIDVILVEEFTREFSRQSAADFITGVLYARIRPVEVYVGQDFHFGKGREASFTALQDLGRELGFGVTVIDEVTVDGAEVSSTRIRRLVAEGRVEEAARLLGRAFTLEGTVEPGAGRGRGMGVATANLRVANELTPADGVYAIFGRIVGPGADPESPGGRKLRAENAGRLQASLIPGVANIGFAPSFGGDRRAVEAHLLDVDRDLYGLEMELLLLARLREERKFPNPEALVAQIRRDIEAARAVHARHGWRVNLE